MTGNANHILRSGALLALIAVAGVGLLAGVDGLTRDRIAEQERLQVLRQLSQVLPLARYDNDPLTDYLELTEPAAFHHAGPVRVYRARLAGEPAAVVMVITAPDGYNGDIRMLVSIFADGVLGGVRVLAHRETPGLGDPIDVRRSDWILGFSGHSLGDPDTSGWAVRKDGGEFDQFTGATITPRAVVAAVRRALEYHAAHREVLYETEGATP
jgi:electron transport complex protein RnfG